MGVPMNKHHHYDVTRKKEKAQKRDRMAKKLEKHTHGTMEDLYEAVSSTPGEQPRSYSRKVYWERAS